MNDYKAVIFFDGVCNLCNSAIDFFIKRDKYKSIRYASLQSEFAKNNLDKHFHEDLDTVVLLLDGRLYTRSEAILRALILLGPPYSIARLFLLLPKFLSDSVYKLIAKFRYRLFGEMDTCRLPTPSEKSLFLE
jgi:predicted DCC family thiol-disulfide oxidoreductase YuxK